MRGAEMLRIKQGKRSFVIALIVLWAVAMVALVVALTGCGTNVRVSDAEQAAKVAKLEAQVKALESQVDSSTSQIEGLNAQLEDQSNQLYELGVASNPQQILKNFDSAMSEYEARLKPRGEEPAIGYRWGNLGDNVFPMIKVMIDSRQIKPAEINKRIDRLERYVVQSETTGDNESPDQDSREVLVKLRKELKGF